MKSRPLVRLFAVLFLVVVEMGIALPVLPALALALGGDALDIGLLYAVQSLGQFVVAPLWGTLSDRLGRRRVIAGTLVLVCVTELLTAFAPHLFLLYLARFLVGLSQGSIAVGSALAADVTDEAGRSRGMAVVGISFGLGFTVGPGVGALLGFVATDGPGPLGAGLPFLAAAGLAAVAAIVAATVLTEPVVSAAERASRRRERPRLRELRALLANRRTHAMLSLNFLYTVAASVMEGTFFIYMFHEYGYDERQVGGLLAGMGLLMALTQGGAVGRVTDALGERAMTLCGALAVAGGLILAPLFSPVWILVAFLSVATVGRAFVHPGILALTSKTAAGRKDPGRVMGALQSSASLGRIVGPAVGGALFEWIHHATPFVAAGILMGLAAVWWYARYGEDEALA